MDNALSDALRHGSVQFVELLVEHGGSFDRLRRTIIINELYRKVCELLSRDNQQL